MRGDSVRDFYAKALALMGLTLLACAGALVDYWPVQGPLPGASFTLALPSNPGPLAVGLALSFRVASPPVRPMAVPAAPAMASAPVALALPLVAVPAEGVLAGPMSAAQVAAAEPPQSVAVGATTPDPIELVASERGVSAPIDAEPVAVSKVSRVSVQENAAPAGNVLQKAGGHILNAGFAVGTGVAKAMGGFGTAMGNIGKLFH